MKPANFLRSTLSAMITLSSAYAFDVTNQVEALSNPISKPDNTFLGAGEFKLRLGFFVFDAGLPNNAAITANQSNVALLESHFRTFFNFDPAQQAQGDLGTNGDVQGEIGANAGGPGTAYAYLTLSDATYNSDVTYAPFRGTAAAGDEPNLYAWFQLVSDSAQQAIFTNSLRTFNPGNDPINSGSVLQIGEGLTGLQVLVGNDRTAAPSNDYQLVPEPTSALLLLGGLGSLAFRRRRA